MSKIVLPDAGYDWRCQRCGHQWRSRHPNEKPPVSCSKCRSAYWQTPKKVKGKTRKKAMDLVDEVELPPPPFLRDQSAPETHIEEEAWDVMEKEEENA